jgi:hypothetical protein
MNSEKTITIGIVMFLMLSAPILVQSDNEGADVIASFEKTRSEILAGRIFNDPSTPANALLTLISALHHQDCDAFEQVFPFARQASLSLPVARSLFLDYFRDSVVRRIQVENKPPRESDICGIHTIASSGDEMGDQIWLLGYIEGAWRLLRSTNDKDVNEWRMIVEDIEASTRNILQFEAKKTGASTRRISQQEAEKIEGKWHIILAGSGQKSVIRFWRKSDGTLTGALTRRSPDDRPLEDVTFENGKLRFKEKVNLAVFEGTMKEDGLTIEGKFQKPDEAFTLVLKRFEKVQPENESQSGTKAVQTSQEQIPCRVSDTSQGVTTLALLVFLAGIIGVVALFVVKHSRA